VKKFSKELSTILDIKGALLCMLISDLHLLTKIVLVEWLVLWVNSATFDMVGTVN